MARQILFDFDGVILDSMHVRDAGFRRIAQECGAADVEGFLQYHRENAGLSRYVKIRYLYEELLGKPVTEEVVMELAAEFSVLMRESLVDRSLLIEETTAFIGRVHEEVPLHVVSGSDERELRYLCRELGLAGFFRGVNGSPTPKDELVARIMEEYSYAPAETVLIGDSKTDLMAANANEIPFYGYNNAALKGLGKGYIETFACVPFEIERSRGD